MNINLNFSNGKSKTTGYSDFVKASGASAGKGNGGNSMPPWARGMGKLRTRKLGDALRGADDDDDGDETDPRKIALRRRLKKSKKLE